MDNKELGGKIFILSVLGLVLAAVLVGPQARASFFGDVWESVKRPFIGTGERGQLESEVDKIREEEKEGVKTGVPLYKPALDYEQAVIAAVLKASPAVVSITVSKNVPIIESCPFNPFSDLPPEFRQFFDDGFFFSQPCEKGTELREIGGGSGFIISSDGLILTNKHVVADTKASYTVFTNDGKKYEARVLARDPVQDLAILKISAARLVTVELGDSDSVQLGQTGIAIGNALGEFRNTVSVGVISGLSRDVTASGGGTTENISGVIQTDAAINPGNSGGPLLNLRGQVIGINTAIVLGAQNIGFAIPINRAKKDIQSVKATGEIQAPYLGVRYIGVTPELTKSQKLPVDYGALVRGGSDGPGVQPGSPAEKAGILVEDVILTINGKKIDQDNQLAEIISEYNVGQSVTLKVNRGGKELALSVKLGKRPAN